MDGSRALLVLGMDRSGTSALTGALGLLGVDLGGPLTPAVAGGNDRGFFEHERLVAIHQRLLRPWVGEPRIDARALPERWWERPEALAAREAICEVLREQFARSRLWGFKDPRLCRLLPLWRGICQDVGARPTYVILARDPREVAASLRRRSRWPELQTEARWLMAILASERHTRGEARVFLTYDQLLDDWRSQARRMGMALDLRWPNPGGEAQVDAFLAGGLRHFGADCASLAETPLTGALAGVYRVLVGAAATEPEPEELSRQLEIAAEPALRVLESLDPRRFLFPSAQPQKRPLRLAHQVDEGRTNERPKCI